MERHPRRCPSVRESRRRGRSTARQSFSVPTTCTILLMKKHLNRTWTFETAVGRCDDEVASATEGIFGMARGERPLPGGSQNITGPEGRQAHEVGFPGGARVSLGSAPACRFPAAPGGITLRELIEFCRHFHQRPGDVWIANVVLHTRRCRRSIRLAAQRCRGFGSCRSSRT